MSENTMSEQKMLSVVMPCFNEISRLEETVREWNSVLEAEVKDFELVIINDGSTDGTGRLLDRLRREMPSLRVFHQLNAGRESAARRGFELARGRYVLQVDANGRFEPNDFLKMWHTRGHYHLILGTRDRAFGDFFEQSFTPILLRVAKYCFGTAPQDPTTPFRLFRRDVAKPYFTTLGQDTTEIGLAVALLMKRDYPEAVGELPVELRRVSAPRRGPGALARVRLNWRRISEALHLGLSQSKLGLRALAPSAA